MNDTLYTEEFYSTRTSGSLASAEVVASLLQSICPVQKVLDIGCGTGTWLRAFLNHGATLVCGIDGDYVSRSQLVIPDNCFIASDLSTTTELPKGFDLAICAEVLEHLPEQSGERLVSLMTESAPLILFSAALPGQGGVHHVNERWHQHWHNKFERHGFVVLDVVRPQILSNTSVEPWYRQNMFLYASEAGFSLWPTLQHLRQQPPSEIVPISPGLLAQFSTIRGLLRHLRRRIVQKLFDFTS